MKRISAAVHAGFTLVEILVVVVILGILSTIVALKVNQHVSSTRREATRAQIRVLRTAINTFEMQVMRLPKDLEELVIEGDEKWPGPFLDSEKVPTDAWGNNFRLQVIGKRFRVTSPGPDGQFETDDDLWE